LFSDSVEDDGDDDYMKCRETVIEAEGINLILAKKLGVGYARAAKL
jgi:hypothetical protein